MLTPTHNSLDGSPARPSTFNCLCLAEGLPGFLLPAAWVPLSYR
jgi:hypothetical protein